MYKNEIEIYEKNEKYKLICTSGLVLISMGSIRYKL